MKVLFISEKYYPYKSGVPIVVKYLAEGLVCKGHEVSVYTTVPDNTELNKIELLNGVRIQRFKLWRNSFKVIKGDVKGIRESVQKENYDCIIFECGQAVSTDVFLDIMGELKPVRLLHAHGLSGLVPSKPFVKKNDLKHTLGHFYNWLRMRYYYNCLFKKAMLNVEAAICLTNKDSGYSYLTSTVKKCYVLGNAAEDMFFDAAKCSYEKILHCKPYCVSIANFTVVKNQIEMMRQFYLTSRKDYSLVLIGSQKTPYYERLLEEKNIMDQKYGKRNIVVITGIEREFFPSILDNSELYLVSSTYEEYSISLIEAMARGIPFVSTNVGNASQLPGGLVVFSISEMHAAIDTLLNDDDKRSLLGRDAKAFAYANCKRSDAINLLEEILEKEVSSKERND